MRLPTTTWALLVGLFALLATPTASAQQLDLDLLHGLEARSIGPAGMSGRVTSIDAVRDNPDIIYLGTASGGLWRSESGGIDWEPIMDDQPVTSIGSVAIYQDNPDIIYVGSGEGNPRNSQSMGGGMFKSIDGGRTWTHLGLTESRNIHRVIIHPDNPNVVFVGAQGPAWGETETRGVFKTTDGGKTWDKVLYVNERTGIGDLVMDPGNPDKLIAAMWEFRRWPWFFESGGEGSGLFVSLDGGDTWTERTSDDGLPKGDLGRMGLAIAPSNPDVVYALVEAEKNGFYRSDDGGFTFRQLRTEGNFGNRPFYYADIYVDPANANHVISLHTTVTHSVDGGKTWETFVPYNDVHPDHHAFYAHPDNSDFMMVGNDGGAAISRDGGDTWRHIENLPLAQFYHISVDNSWPYNVCGGMQDNGSWCGPAYTLRNGGIRNAYWEEVAFGDGFDVVIHPTNLNIGFAMSQGGNLRRFDLTTGYQKNVKPIHPDGVQLRFNWNAAIAQNPFNPDGYYYGSQFVHKSDDLGDTWTIISPDLTTNDPEKQKQIDSGGLTYDVTQAENHTTIVSIEPSPLDANLIWVGTDDGNLQVTRDGGATWTNVVDRIRGVPAGTWVPQIRASVHNAGEAYVVFEDHRRNNWEPYLYRTRDYGQSWERLAGPDDVDGYVLSVAQDPIAPNLLFMGTELGLYVSIDAGATWTSFTNGYPTASTIDLAIHPREHDLVIGTFGRSAFVLDDIRPLREMAQEGADLMDEMVHVFEAPTAYHSISRQATGVRFIADAVFAGENRRSGAMITFTVNPDAYEAMAEAQAAEDDTETSGPNASGTASMASDDMGEKDKVKLEILNADGEVIRTLNREVKAGVNRTYWGLDQKGVRRGGGGSWGAGMGNREEPGGADVLPGTYTARITYGGQTSETTINVEMDPRVEVNMADLQARHDMYMTWERHVEILAKAEERMRKAGETVDAINKQLGDRDDEAAEELKKQGKAVKDRLTEIEEMIEGKEAKGIRRDPTTLNSLMNTARGYIRSGMNAPDPSASIAMEQARGKMQEVLDAVNTFFADDWPAYRSAVNAANVSLFEDYEPLEME